MATRTWSASAGQTDMNDPNNYSGSGALLTTDDLVFDSTSVVNATMTADLSVGTVSFAGTYSGNFSDGGFNLTTATTQNFSHTGTFTKNGNWTMTGNGTFTLSSSVGTVTVSVTSWHEFQGNDTFLCSKTGVVWGIIKGGYGSGKNLTKSGTTASYVTQFEVLDSAGVINWSSSETHVRGATPFATNVGTFRNNTHTYVAEIPANVTLKGGTLDCYLDFTGAQACAIILEAALTCKRINCINNGGYTRSFDTQGNNITITADTFNISNGNISLLSVILSSSIVTIATRMTITSTASNRLVSVSLTTGTIKFGENFVLSGTTGLTFTPGTSTLEANGTGAQSITLAGKSVYNVKVNTGHGANAITFADALNCNRLQIGVNTIIKWKDGVTHTVATYTSGDWNGTSGNLVTFNSLVAGSTYTIANPASMAVQYMKVRDCIATNLVDATVNCTDDGNNTLWNFSAVNWFLLQMRNQLAYPNNF